MDRGKDLKGGGKGKVKIANTSTMSHTRHRGG